MINKYWNNKRMDKSVAPKKDFTIYTNEKGEQFKTTERVIKGNIY